MPFQTNTRNTQTTDDKTTVVLACRSRAKGDALAKLIAADAAAAGRAGAAPVEVADLDLDSLASVRAFVAAWERSARPLHILVNNAGVFHMGGALG